MISHDDYAALAVAWAMDGLEPDELHLFESHLHTCPQCAQLVSETQETLATLALALVPNPRVPPLPEQLTATRQRPSRRTEPHVVRASVSGRGRSRPYWRAAALVAAAVAVVGLGAWNVVLRQDRDHTRTAAAEYRRAVQALLTNGAHRADLTAPSGATLATVITTDAGMTLVSDELPGNGSASVYVLWGKAGSAGKPQALTTFDVTHPVTVVSTHRFRYVEYMLSREPGHTAPTRPSSIIAAS